MTPLVKICGITRVEDALLACELGAAAIGFIFWPDSRRFVEPEVARTIVAALPPFVTPVGVFVNQPAAHIASVSSLVKLGAVQLHGDELAASYADPPLRVIKAVPVTATFDAARACHEVPGSATMLLDAADPVRRGGTGRTVDWSAAAAAARLRPVVLSGGLNAANISEAIDRVRPYAVDVSSGVESAPGIKDPVRLRAFFAAFTTASVHP